MERSTLSRMLSGLNSQVERIAFDSSISSFSSELLSRLTVDLLFYFLEQLKVTITFHVDEPKRDSTVVSMIKIQLFAQSSLESVQSIAVLAGQVIFPPSVERIRWRWIVQFPSIRASSFMM